MGSAGQPQKSDRPFYHLGRSEKKTPTLHSGEIDFLLRPTFRFRIYRFLPTLKFPFYTFPTSPTDPLGRHSILRPVIDVRLYGPRGHISALALVDSGSDDTIFDHEYAETIGIDWESGGSHDITGVSGGTVRVHFKSVTYEISGHRFTADVGFAKMPLTFKAVLGQTGFFDQTIVKLDHGNKRIEIMF